MVLGVVWHFWFAPILVLTVFAILATTLFGYLAQGLLPPLPQELTPSASLRD